jgi:ABC-type antimicrobial peptide transport system permease subunit
MVLSSLAALALGLTALGIFSVVAYLVASRSREMGVRLAVGASPRSLVALVVRDALTPVAIGLASGLLLVLWGRRLAEAQLFKVDTNDPLMLAVAIATVVTAALVAAYLPALRTTRINPTDVLRAE